MPQNSKLKPLHKYLRYSGMAFEFIIAIGLGAWLGTYTDKWLGNQKPIATLLLMMLFLGAALFHIIRSLMKEQ